MKLKTVEVEGKTYAELQDGKPVYVHDDGKEIAFDAPGTVAKIGQLNGEAKGHREAKEAAEARLKDYEGIEDPAAALDALKKVQSLQDKELVDAGKVEEIRTAVVQAKDAEYKPIVEERDSLKKALNKEMIGGSFSRSKYITEKMAVPADIIEARFGSNFSIEDGKVVAKDASGNQIYSKANPGEAASFDEALEILIDQYPYKDNLLKGAGGTGSGAQPNDGNGTGGAKTISRKDFNALSQLDRQAKVKDGFKVVDTAA